MKHPFIALALLISIGLPAMTQAQGVLEDIARALQARDRAAEEASEFAAASPILVAAPLNRWVLLRKGNALCALRFTTFRHEPVKDKMPSTTRDSFFASYDWFYQADGSQELSKPNVQSGHGEASQKPNLWRIARGSRFVKCGSIKAQWGYPNSILLINRNYNIPYDPKISDQPNDIEVALTGWKNIKDVNALDPRLTWHRYNAQGDLAHNNDVPTRIPVEQLPGFD